MPGIATHFTILRLTIDELKKPVSGSTLNNIALVMETHSAYAHLGAIGPALGYFVPSGQSEGRPPAEGAYGEIWRAIFGMLGGEIGLLATLTKVKAMICRMERICADEDRSALLDLKESGEFDKMKQTSKEFAELIQGVYGIAKDISDKIRTDLRPAISTASKADPVPPPADWQLRDVLHWRRTGVFARKLLQRANTSGDFRFLAYAYGFLVSSAANVCGTPFINSTVGGPPRTQWWRQWFVKNYHDAWVYGFYNAGATMSGDDPAPAYKSWPSLCDANLHKRIAFGPIDIADTLSRIKYLDPLPQHMLPDDFSQFWLDAYTDAYGPLPAGSPLTPAAINDAYVMTWLVLWFQTSGEVVGWFTCAGDNPVLGCTMPEKMDPPDDCGDAPNALDPFQKDADGNPILPPEPQIDEDAVKRKTICARILQIIGVAIALAANFAIGASFVFAGDKVLDDAIDWKDLRCKIFWYRKYLYNGMLAIADLLAIAGFAYPSAKALGDDEVTLVAAGIPYTWRTGKLLVKSNVMDDIDYPSKCLKLKEVAFLDTFNDPPTASDPGFEKPRATGCLSSAYPSFYVNDNASNPLSAGDVKTGTLAFPFRPSIGNPGKPMQFGNAVANAVDLFKNLNRDLPDWNLDADRGVGYVTWQFRNARYDPDAVDIEPQP